jgi:hypothetical protein
MQPYCKNSKKFIFLRLNQIYILFMYIILSVTKANKLNLDKIQYFSIFSLWELCQNKYITVVLILSKTVTPGVYIKKRFAFFDY